MMGREYAGSTNAPNYNDSDRTGFSSMPYVNSPTALATYIEYYTYDKVGNITQIKHTAGTTPFSNYWTRINTIAGGSNQLTGSAVGSSSESYTPDARGNIVTGFSYLYTGGGNSMSYNEENRLETVAMASTIKAYYQYDGSGQRVRKTVEDTSTGGLTKTRRYIGQWETYQEASSGSVSLIRETLHVNDDAARIVLIDTELDPTGTGTVITRTQRYQFTNHLGTAVLELDESANVITYEEYYPFGGSSFQSGRSAAEVSLKRYRFTGKERDEETGFYYHGARYYVPWLARWCATDPLWDFNKSMSSYSYCSNNPILKKDPSGTTDKYYYDTSGQLLGKEKIVEKESKNDGKNKEAKKNGKNKTKEDEVYVADNKSVGKDGQVTYVNAHKLDITHKDFLRYAALVANEDGKTREVSFAIASAVMNYAKFSKAEGGDKTLHSLLNGHYSAADKAFSVDNNNATDVQAIAAVINAFNGGHDYSNGATHWDGYDLAAKGNTQIKFREQGVKISKEHLDSFMAAWTDDKIKAYSGGEYTKKSTDFKSGDFYAKSGVNKGRELYESFAVQSETIFWKPNKDHDLATDYNKIPTVTVEKDKLVITIFKMHANKGYLWRYY